MSARARLLVAIAIALLGCRARPHDDARPASDAAATTSVSALAASSSPRDAASDLPATESMAVAGYGDAIVTPARIDLSAPAPRPLMIVAHGYGEDPEPMCDLFRSIAAGRAFVLCLRGTPRKPPATGSEYLSEWSLALELDAALAALHARYGDRLEADAIVWVGFSMGASFAVMTIAERPTQLPRVVMIEGGVTDWSPARIQRFAAHGGKRVLFGCGRASRVGVTQSIAKQMRAFGLEADVAIGSYPDGSEVGHDWGGPLADAMRTRFEWLIADDPRWKIGR